MRGVGNRQVDLNIGSSPSGGRTTISLPQPASETSGLLVNAVVATPQQQQQEEADAVERALHSSLHGLILIFVLILVGILSLLLRAMDPQLSVLSYWVIFVPFWLADLVGFGLQGYLLVLTSTIRFYTPEQKRNIIQ